MTVISTPILTDNIASGIDFLSHRQHPSGHFVTQRLSNNDSSGVRPVDNISTFVTACVVYCLQWIPTNQSEDIRQKALDSILAEPRFRGLYRFFAEEQSYSPPGLGGRLPMTMVPDCDTTSCASFILARYGRGIDSRAALLALRNLQGLFPTWSCEAAQDLDDSFPFFIVVPTDNEPCIAVNANVLTYLGDGPETRAVSEYICSIYKSGSPEDHANWYEEILIAYMCSRAFFEGAVSLAPIRDSLLERLYIRQQSDGSFGTVIETAAAACTLLNFGVVGRVLEAALQFLTKAQRADGSWPSDTFYIGDERTSGIEMRLKGARLMVQPPAQGDQPVMAYFGSEEITTAYCLEALSRSAETR